MGADYALVHLYWNLPPAFLLTFLYKPFQTSLDVYKTCFLIAIAVISTIPWDSYLIRCKVWSYPQDAVLGPTFLDIPIEELFFFVIQTYNTSLLYCLLSKSTFHPVYLRGEKTQQSLLACKWTVGAFIAAVTGAGEFMVRKGGRGFYMGLILIWAGPFTLLLWMLAYQFIILLPIKDTIFSILLPTLYLWLVDTLALRRGTWVIENGTKLNWQLWEGLDIESVLDLVGTEVLLTEDREAFFFFATNTLIVFGLVTFDNALAILQTFPSLFPDPGSLPSPLSKIRALIAPVQAYDEGRIAGLQQALTRLQQKSRSFYIASSVFPGRIRIDLVILYSFCRVADDLVDESPTPSEARSSIKLLRHYLDLAYSPTTGGELRAFIENSFPASSHSSLLLLPTSYLPSGPLYSLLDGFEMDLGFGEGQFPMKTDADLELYAGLVAGTVAELCISLVYHHNKSSLTIGSKEVRGIIASGGRMGVALQLVNIARDIRADALIGRVYLPETRLKTHGLAPCNILSAYQGQMIDSEFDSKIYLARNELLEWAMTVYHNARRDIEKLPAGSRGGVRVMAESYVEIGRVLLREKRSKPLMRGNGRATVSRWRRIWVAWRAMIG